VTVAGHDQRVEPRTFFLNEHHELTRGTEEGGGALPSYDYEAIPWADRADRLTGSLDRTKAEVDRSQDPTRGRHYFVLAVGVPTVPKVSRSRTKTRPDEKYDETTRFDAGNARVLRRLGLDLISARGPNHALVHATAEHFEKLRSSAAALPNEGKGARARWAVIDSFELIPSEARVDRDWLDSLSETEATDVMVELQPLLTAVEADELARAIARRLGNDRGEGLKRTGADFSGRVWLAARMRPSTIAAIAREFFSVQSLHPPLFTALAQATKAKARASASRPVVPRIDAVGLARLPVVGVLDAGVPADHVVLAQYRHGRYTQIPGEPTTYIGPHGSFVASRVVFGDLDFDLGVADPPEPTCKFYDAMIGQPKSLTLDEAKIDDKAVIEALRTVRATAPEVRVFNLSFDGAPLAQITGVKREEKLLLVQDLDNFIFQNDVLVVVSAGNADEHATPQKPYPRHVDDPAWSLGPWARSFNALTCGSFTNRTTERGLAGQAGWPSPFSRVGPGIANSPKPDFAAHGGDAPKVAEDGTSGLGVWVCSHLGDWVDRLGTSHAAPLLAREAAFVLQHLQTKTEAPARPFAATAKAFLALTARPPATALPAPVRPLAARALGHGHAKADRLHTPQADTAVFIWQAVLEGPHDIARVRVPIPRDWLAAAADPRLVVVWAWDTPVNKAVEGIWGCRSVGVRLRPAPDARALNARGSGDRYPLARREFHLGDVAAAGGLASDEWVLDVRYEERTIAPPMFEVNAQQRVGLALELRDQAEAAANPQAYVQRLEAAATMFRMPLLGTPLAVPIVLRAR
jgi:hypothetical protein